MAFRCRRIEREQQGIEREYQRLEKERRRQEALSNIKLSLNKEHGTIQIENSFGEPLSRGDLKLLWDQKGNTILEWLEQQAEEINGDMELLTKIHEDTPSPDSEPEYQIVPFNEAPPNQPKLPEKELKPELRLLPPLGFFARLFKSKRTAYDEKQRQLNDEHKKEMLDREEENKRRSDNYQTALQKYEAAKEEWEERKMEHEANEGIEPFQPDSL